MEEDKLSWIVSFSAIVNQATTSFLSLPLFLLSLISVSGAEDQTQGLVHDCQIFLSLNYLSLSKTRIIV